MSSLFPLVLREASVRRRGKVLVGPINLTLQDQGVTMVIGPNGAGKTTFLRMLHGIARLGSGAVQWACDNETAQARQAFVFQSPIMMRRSVLGNLTYPLRLRGVSRREARSQATIAAQDVGLGEMLDRPAPFLSGGEQQKLALARALITKPDLLFLDEPCASLDGRATREIEDILFGAVKAGTRLIMSTHDMGQARRLGTDVLFFVNGALYEYNEAVQFFVQPNTPQARAFLKGDIVE